MTPKDLLASWPTFKKANADKFISHPALNIPVIYTGGKAILTFADIEQQDSINLKIELGGEETILSLYDCTSFADLHSLWNMRAGLPEEIILALIEKECGELFQMLEKSTNMLFAIKGFCSEPAQGKMAVLSLGNGEIINFRLTFTPTIKVSLGKIEYINTNHELIRSLLRPARAIYAQFEEEIEGVEIGDYIACSIAPMWHFDELNEGTFLAGESRDISFAEMVDDKMPPLPKPERLVLLKDGCEIAKGEIRDLGVATALYVEEI